MKAFTIILSLLFLCGINLQAEDQKPETEEKKEEKKLPIQIDSEHSKIDDNKGKIYFSGNVVVDDGVVKLNCDFMTVTLDDKRKAKIIVCEKNVVIRKENMISHSDMATYILAEEKITLTGTPKVTQTNEKGEKSDMAGKRIVIYRNTNVIETYASTFNIAPGSKGLDDKKDKEKKDEDK